MKRFTLMTCALFAFAAAGCEDTQDANAKIQQCLEDEYGADAAEDLIPEWELTCDEHDSACRTCIDCVVDAECDSLLGGSCDSPCEEAETPDEDDTDE